MSQLTANIASLPDRENVVFEIWQGPRQLAEVSREPGKPMEIAIYPAIYGGIWSLELEPLVSLLNQAVANLTSTTP